MLFNSLEFFAFFLVFVILYMGVARTRDQKLWCITLASFVFYATFDYRYVPLLLGTALVDFYVARAIAHTENKTRRKRLLWLSIGLNLAVLGFFKYADFFLGSAFGLFQLLGFTRRPSPPLLNLVVPVGISFYTFQSMSYTIDVYRKELMARERPIEFLAAITFFPHLLMGPIIRASTLLPQFETLRPSSWDEIGRGFRLIAIGLVNKTMADLMAGPVEAFFAKPQAHSAFESWTAALAFLGQVYGDFAGYSSMAIGIALLIGFKIPRNFNLPYIASSIGEFWRRWHISLSFWFRDYVFLPLALKEKGRPYRSTIFTTTLVGFWHTANWPCLIYGLYHGILVALNNFINAPKRGPLRNALHGLGKSPSPLVKVLKIALTLYLVVIGETIFRATSLKHGLGVLRDMHGSGTPSDFSHANVMTFILIVVGLISGHLLSTLETEAETTPLAVTLRRPAVLWPLVVTGFAFALAFGISGHAFFYFQF